MAKAPKTIKFKYVFADDYNPVYANGVFGGVSPSGEVVISFYQERHPIPNSQTHVINENGTLGEETAREPSDHQQTMVRFVSSGVTLNLKSAIQIHEWLGQQIAVAREVEELRTKQEKRS